MTAAFDQARLGSQGMSGDLTKAAKRVAMIAAPVGGSTGSRLDRRSTQGHAITLQIRPAAEASPSSFATPKRWNGRIVAR